VLTLLALFAKNDGKQDAFWNPRILQEARNQQSLLGKRARRMQTRCRPAKLKTRTASKETAKLPTKQLIYDKILCVQSLIKRTLLENFSICTLLFVSFNTHSSSPQALYKVSVERESNIFLLKTAKNFTRNTFFVAVLSAQGENYCYRIQIVKIMYETNIYKINKIIYVA